RRTSASVNGAVKLNVSESGVLSVGIAAGASQFRVDRNKLTTSDPNDPTIDNADMNLIQPDLKLGVYFHTDRFYLGVSATDLIGMKQETAFNPERSYFLTTGYVFDLGEHLKFKPSILMKENFHGPTNLDLNAFLLFENRIWLGGTYRTAANIFKNNFEAKDLANKDAVSAIGEVFLSPKLRLGYSYDFTLTQLNNYSTHEFSLGVLLFKKAETKMLTPQYF
ncbi:MAG: type IX secretion system membrane protein PorP/SprF, partial [Bacteroidota bacterium]|nr:type IX secretion system membrane protein PorP/SprF [Bacteroidota bacterium]